MSVSAYKDSITVDDCSSEQHLQTASEALGRGLGVVIFNDKLALRPTASAIFCEVIDPDPDSHRCEEEFRVLIENARRDLANSKLGRILPNKTLQWLVVKESGTGIVEVWPGPGKID